MPETPPTPPSTPSHPPMPPMQRPPAPMGQPKQTNGLGLAGFICSLVLCVPLLGFVGLILSLVALKREPKGLAIAGAIIGGITTAVWAILFATFGLAIIGLGTAVAIGLPTASAYLEMAHLQTELEAYHDSRGALPPTIAALPASKIETDWLTDHWGNPYVYEPSTNRQTFRLYSTGPDGIAGTTDDIDLSNRPTFEFPDQP